MARNPLLQLSLIGRLHVTLDPALEHAARAVLYFLQSRDFVLQVAEVPIGLNVRYFIIPLKWDHEGGLYRATSRFTGVICEIHLDPSPQIVLRFIA